jgi:signal transduction histidine kinase
MSKKNLYHQKQRWKIALIGAAIIMVAASLWFSFQIVDKVKDKELDRVQQWADAVKRKSELVNLTNNTFVELGNALELLKERDQQKVMMWSSAMEEINKPMDDYTFAVSILQQNNSIPIILTDQEGEIVSNYNLENLERKIAANVSENNPKLSKKPLDSLVKAVINDSLKSYLPFWSKQHDPFEIELSYGEKQYAYYFDSIYYKTEKLKELQLSRDSLSNAFTRELIDNEYLVPVFFVDQFSRAVLATNIERYDSTNANEIINELSALNDSITVKLVNGHTGVIYFQYSPEITQMKYFPFIQFFIIGLFVLIAYLVFSTFRKAEQDQVWVGMAKETAHQLGTPISSLMAWNQLLDAQGVDKSITTEIDKDIDRLSTVTNRFSKIGSEAILKEENIVEIIQESVAYLRIRISKKIALIFEPERDEILGMANRSLLEWVVENITKNAVDAIEGEGEIRIALRQIEDRIQIDITDNGRGIESNRIKTVFQPGFTTKQRGWGLGLSLVKRIVEDFHKGKVYVLKSEVGVGTTFRITLKV